MKTYESFIFDSYSFNPLSATVELHYSLDDEVKFTEVVKLPRKGLSVKNLNKDLLDRALFALHLIGGISYYKTCCPKNIVVRSGNLTESQAKFWNEVYENGLGEFFYRNNIDFRDLIKFPVEAEDEPNLIPFETEHDRALVPVGGGKDSVVTFELLKKAGVDTTLFRMNDHPVIDTLVSVTNLPLMSAERRLSPEIFKLNAEGALNGHVPITGYLSFLTIVTSVLYGFNTVVMSNERSANEGSVLFYGKEINHQWSKSLAFETMFREYVRANITPDIQYFSLLRPLSELHIVKLFVEFPRYLQAATSCNTNWKLLAKKEPTTLWCTKCPKCAFVFALYAAFLPSEMVVALFEKNLFEDAELLPLYRALLGMEGFKPFECVGTAEEVRAAFILIRDRDGFNDTPVMELFKRELLPTIEDARGVVKNALTPSIDHAIPPTFATVLSFE